MISSGGGSDGPCDVGFGRDGLQLHQVLSGLVQYSLDLLVPRES